MPICQQPSGLNGRERRERRLAALRLCWSQISAFGRPGCPTQPCTSRVTASWLTCLWTGPGSSPSGPREHFISCWHLRPYAHCPNEDYSVLPTGGLRGWGQQLEKLYFRTTRDRSDKVRKLFMVFVSKTLIPSKPYWETENSTRLQQHPPPPQHQQSVNTKGGGIQIQVWLG